MFYFISYFLYFSYSNSEGNFLQTFLNEPWESFAYQNRLFGSLSIQLTLGLSFGPYITPEVFASADRFLMTVYTLREVGINKFIFVALLFQLVRPEITLQLKILSEKIWELGS